MRDRLGALPLFADLDEAQLDRLAAATSEFEAPAGQALIERGRPGSGMFVLEQGQAQNMKLGGGRIFVITAGMMSENTAAHELALRMIGDERHAIFFVGYADPDTPGGRLKASQPGETFVFSGAAGEVTRRCELESFDLTAHANREELLDFVGQVEPRAVLLGHGEADSRQWFEEQIRARHPKMRIIQPQPGLSVDV